MDHEVEWALALEEDLPDFSIRWLKPWCSQIVHLLYYPMKCLILLLSCSESFSMESHEQPYQWQVPKHCVSTRSFQHGPESNLLPITMTPGDVIFDSILPGEQTESKQHGERCVQVGSRNLPTDGEITLCTAHTRHSRSVYQKCIDGSSFRITQTNIFHAFGILVINTSSGTWNQNAHVWLSLCG